jgi:peptidoglycan/xylan/chitin deacetylase (PgdA/CDA1 family)
MLVVMYHGVTNNRYDPPVWTQLPVDKFRSHMEFLRKHYRIVSLAEVVAAVRSERNIPQRAALITFDDGLMNNYTVAFPVLKELGIPATIFLTSDFIGTDRFFWFDDLYILLKHLCQQENNLSYVEFVVEMGLPTCPAGEFPYFQLVNHMKRLPAAVRDDLLGCLRQKVSIDVGQYSEDFCALGWDEVKIMQTSGLIEFGAHTASHEILTNLDEKGLEREVTASRGFLEKHLGRPVLSFCYPNGGSELDFTRNHREFLARSEFLCAFSSENRLNRDNEDMFALGRIPVGNDLTAQPELFRLSTAGVLEFVGKWRYTRT